MGSKNSKKKKKNTNTNTNIHSKNSQINKTIKKDLNKNEINFVKEEIKSLSLSKNKEFLNIPSPIFKNIKKLDINIDDIFQSNKFTIYKLKEINNAFYISFLGYEGIEIYKCYYENKMLEKINTIKINVSPMEEIIMRYFYIELEKKEYFFVEKGLDNLFIYLIKNEKNYELINKNECRDFEYDYEIEFNRDIIPNEEKLDLFEIIYNQFDKNIYIVTIQSIGYRSSTQFEGYDSKEFNIKTFKENKFISSKLLYSNKYPIRNDLIYEDNHSKKYYILSLLGKKFIMIQIKEYHSDYQTIDIEKIKDIENIVCSEKDIKTLNEFYDKGIYNYSIIYDKYCKKIFYGYNGNFLYLSNNFEETSSEIIVIDLFKRKIIKQFILNIDIYSFENWGSQNIIILSNNSIYIFDPYTFQITTKYSSIWEKDYPAKIETYFSKENNFYGLFINSSEFKLMYLNKNK